MTHRQTKTRLAKRRTCKRRTKKFFPLDNEDFGDADSAQTDFSTLDSPTEQKRPATLPPHLSIPPMTTLTASVGLSATSIVKSKK
jgi:hypothetical protein